MGRWTSNASHRRLDLVGDPLGGVVLPEAEGRPADRSKVSVAIGVPLPVSSDLLLPPPSVRLR